MVNGSLCVLSHNNHRRRRRRVDFALSRSIGVRPRLLASAARSPHRHLAVMGDCWVYAKKKTGEREREREEGGRKPTGRAEKPEGFGLFVVVTSDGGHVYNRTRENSRAENVEENCQPAQPSPPPPLGKGEERIRERHHHQHVAWPSPVV